MTENIKELRDQVNFESTEIEMKSIENSASKNELELSKLYKEKVENIDSDCEAVLLKLDDIKNLTPIQLSVRLENTEKKTRGDKRFG